MKNMSKGSSTVGKVLHITEKDDEFITTITNVSLEWTVWELKEVIYSKTNYLPEIINLHFSSQVLINSRKLFSYHIELGDTINMTFRHGYVIMELGNRKSYISEATTHWTVAQFRQAVSIIISSPPKQITLTYRTRVLQDRDTLGSYNVEPGECISVGLKKCGCF